MHTSVNLFAALSSTDEPAKQHGLVSCWWVNQNQTYSEEVSGGFLWSPKTKTNGHRNPFYDFMKEVRTGDVVFSFCDTRIRAVGVAIGSARSVPKPNFKAGGNWSDEGWYVPVEFTELEHTVRPKDHIEKILPYLPDKYSPLRRNGDGLQSVYLTRVSNEMAEVLLGLIGPEYGAAIDRARVLEEETLCDSVEEAIVGRTDIGPTMKEQLVKSRRGQGLFKINVRRNEKACRVTGVTDPRNLRASHIKPWKDCSDVEKLNGCNGLLLAPHVDHLFDRGFITFADDGELLISPLLDRTILARWGIPEVLNVGTMKKQAKFLAHHREHVFRK